MCFSGSTLCVSCLPGPTPRVFGAPWSVSGMLISRCVILTVKCHITVKNRVQMGRQAGRTGGQRQTGSQAWRGLPKHVGYVVRDLHGNDLLETAPKVAEISLSPTSVVVFSCGNVLARRSVRRKESTHTYRPCKCSPNDTHGQTVDPWNGLVAPLAQQLGVARHIQYKQGPICKVPGTRSENTN